MAWRWDQGRLLYFQFDVLKNISKVLLQYDAVDIKMCENEFRTSLTNVTGMPFAPTHYTVLRNYKRVFECAFLATVADGKLVVTDFCRELAKADGKISNVDEYLFNYISKFRFPFPAFDNYNNVEQQVYPFCAILKFLLALHQKKVEAAITIDDVFHYVIANNCTGFEKLDFYLNLKPQAYAIQETERRQLREMLIFISQLSVLKIYNGKLYLDVITDNAVHEMLQQFVEPKFKTPKQWKAEEFLSMTSLSAKIVVPTFEVFAADIADVEFIEGKRRRTEHLRVERSPLLRKYYIEQNKEPICCMCGMNLSQKYPWTEYMLDIHHLLPLASSVAITSKGTSLADIVGLCPSCHRSIHIYYRKWLKANKQEDFTSKIEAREVFYLAAKEIA